MFRIVLLLCCFVVPGVAQVLDDTTRQVYSNATVEYIYERDVLRNIQRSYNPDSSLKYYHYSSPFRRSGGLFQDLGNVGTSARPFLFQKFRGTGQHMGMESHLLYAPDPDLFKYYNTRSPYTYLAYQQGGGHTQFDVTHSQNIHPRWNITLNIFKFNSQKQYGFIRSEEVLVNHWRYDVSTNYTSKNGKYKLLASFYHFNHKQFEQGGIKGGDTLSHIEPKYARNYDAALKPGIFNRERWNNLHLYQQFLLKNSIQTFHILDFERKTYGFFDPLFTDSTSAALYGIQAPATEDTLNFHNRLITLSNSVGFKGTYKGFNYQVYAKSRLYKLNSPVYPAMGLAWKPEFYLGGMVGYVFPDSTNTLDISAEVESHKNYKFDATLFYKGFEIGFYNAARPAGLFYQRFQNRAIQFRNDLNPENAKIFSVKLPLQLGRYFLQPEARWSSIKNYTYLPWVDQVAQLDADLNLFNLGATLGYSGKNFDARYRILYNTSSHEPVYAVPRLLHTANVEFNFLYAKVLRIYTGLDVFYSTSYYGQYYSPLVNQFLAQLGQKTGGVPLADVYIKFPISKGRISLNWQFINKGLGWNGVFTTPGYIGQPGALMIKIDWPLFD
jgi:hypothetical protein